jgi:virginiamycin A acetyltransferase
MRILLKNLLNSAGLMTYHIVGYILASLNGARLGPCAKVSPRAKLGRTCYLGNVSVAGGVQIGYGTLVNSGIIDSGIIGRYCSIAYDVHIGPTEHASENWTTSPYLALKIERSDESAIAAKRAPIIQDEVWIGCKAIILRGVTIGQGAVIGAGAVVTKDIPPYEIWAGVPARFIRKRFRDEENTAKSRALLSSVLGSN